MKALCVLLMAGLLMAPLCALAEGSGHPYTGEGDAEAKPKVVKKPRPKPKPVAPAPKLPDAPIPYQTLNGTPLSPDMAKALTPTAAPHADAAAAAAPIQALPVQAVEVAPPPPPVTPVDASPPTVVVIQAPPPAEISLKCETTTTRGGKTVSTGSFFITIVPSPVFPNDDASFQFRFVDPGHTSLIRDTVCLDIACHAKVSPSTYALVNTMTKGGDALRVTLDRTRGRFYAEAIDDGLVRSAHLGEEGWCTPQPIAVKALF